MYFAWILMRISPFPHKFTEYIFKNISSAAVYICIRVISDNISPKNSMFFENYFLNKISISI